MPASSGLIALGYVLLFLSSTLSSSAGVGGGLLNVAIIHGVQGYDIKSAAVLSLSAILGNTLVQLLINIRTRHPNCVSRMAVYWDMVVVMLPAQLAGANLGVIFADMVPTTVSYIAAILVLLIGGYFTVLKAFHLREMEDERAAKGNAQGSLASATSNPMSAVETNSVAEETGVAMRDSDDLHGKKGNHRMSIDELASGMSLSFDERDKSLEAISKTLQAPLVIPYRIIAVLAAVWLSYMVIYIVMESVPGCSASWGVTFAFIYIILAVVAPSVFKYLNSVQAANPESILPGDITWGPSAYVIPMVTFSIGVLTAILGFGGGELIGPYLLQLHVQPIVSTATSGMMSFLNTGLSLVHYGILGKVDYGPSGILVAIGAVAGLCGRLFSLFVVAKFDRASMLVFALVMVLFLSWIMYIVYLATEKADFTTDGFCS